MILNDDQIVADDYDSDDYQMVPQDYQMVLDDYQMVPNEPK